MYKMTQLYIRFNLAEYAMTLIYFMSVSIFYKKFHNAEGYCRIRRTYMLVIWMFNFSVQFYGMWIVYGTASEEITTHSCEMNEEVENDPC